MSTTTIITSLTAICLLMFGCNARVAGPTPQSADIDKERSKLKQFGLVNTALQPSPGSFGPIFNTPDILDSNTIEALLSRKLSNHMENPGNAPIKYAIEATSSRTLVFLSDTVRSQDFNYVSPVVLFSTPINRLYDLQNQSEDYLKSLSLGDLLKDVLLIMTEFGLNTPEGTPYESINTVLFTKRYIIIAALPSPLIDDDSENESPTLERIFSE